MLLSVVSPWNVRVLESYFDGSKLVVRKTRSYDMSKEYDWTIERLWRLWHGGCIGNTTTLPEKPMTGQ